MFLHIFNKTLSYKYFNNVLLMLVDAITTIPFLSMLSAFRLEVIMSATKN
jgi:hypothetical protein